MGEGDMKRHQGTYPAPVTGVPGRTSQEDVEWLYKQARKHRTIVEVGSACGKSSHALLTGNYESFGPAGRVYCVDCWPVKVVGTRDEFDYGHKDLAARTLFWAWCGQFPNLNMVELRSVMARKALSDVGADMVFLDGGVANMAVDIEVWRKVPSSVLSGHDYTDEYPMVRRAVDFSFGPDVRMDGVGSSIWWVRARR